MLDQRATSHQAYNLILPAGVVQQGRRYSNSLSGKVEDLLVRQKCIETGTPWDFVRNVHR